MPLSEHEKRQLEELERALHEPAAPPARPGVAARRGWVTTRRLLAFSTLGMLGGLVLLLSGLAAGSGVGITLAVVGCVLVLACSLVAVPALTKARRPRWPRGGGTDVRIPGPRPGSGQSPAPRAGLDVGDRVTAAEGLGGFLRPRVPAGTPGVITTRLPGGLLRVRFVTGQAVSAAPGQLAHAGQP